jgi:rare lipoprotein A
VTRAARRRALGALLAAALPAACGPSPQAPRPEARYVVGEAYALSGIWSYPREDLALVETGVAVVLPDVRPGRRTANGDIHDPGALVAAQRTLQLPAILSVTNLETGREIRVLANDRGPAQPGRVLGPSRRAAELLGIPPGGGAQVRIAVDAEASRALAAALPSAEPSRVLPIATAPRPAVEAEPLAPLPDARGVDAVSGRGVSGDAAAAATAAAPGAPAAPPPERLPEVVAQRAASPGRLVVEAGTFFRQDLAQRQAGRLTGLGAQVDTVGSGRQAVHRVRIGPFRPGGCWGAGLRPAGGSADGRIETLAPRTPLGA